MARFTINTKAETPSDLARAFRSAAAKLDAADLTPGSDVKVGNLRIQVAEVQESPIRAFARAEGIPVGARGRFSQELQDRYAAHLKAERKAAREAAKARKAERELANA